MTSNDYFKSVAASALARFDSVMDWLGLSGGKNAQLCQLDHCFLSHLTRYS